MPVVHPAELWQDERALRRDRPGAGPVQGPRRPGHGPGDDPRGGRRDPARATSSRATASSRSIVYHFQTKFRDEPRARGGLIRVREFVMKDAYSCDRDEAGLDVSYREQSRRLRPDLRAPRPRRDRRRADVGIMGGIRAHEFMVAQPCGEDILVLCEACGYAAQPAGRARSRKPAPEAEELLPMEDVETPDTTTIDALAAFLAIPRAQDRQGRVLRDRRRALRRRRSSAATTTSTRPSWSTRSRRSARPPPGAGRGDQGARHGGRLRLADRRPRRGRRRRRARRALAQPGRRREQRRLPPAEHQRPARLHAGRRRRHRQRPRGRRLPGLRRRRSTCATGSRSATSSSSAPSSRTPLGATYLGEDGERHPIVMGSYGIGLGRNVACIVEAHHDEKGIVWPAEVAPYPAHLVALGANREPRVTEVAERLYAAAAAARTGPRDPVRRPRRVARA